MCSTVTVRRDIRTCFSAFDAGKYVLPKFTGKKSQKCIYAFLIDADDMWNKIMF